MPSFLMQPYVRLRLKNQKIAQAKMHGNVYMEMEMEMENGISSGFSVIFISFHATRDHFHAIILTFLASFPQGVQ